MSSLFGAPVTTVAVPTSAGAIPGAPEGATEKEDDFNIHPTQLQQLANFLVRLGLFAADNKDPVLARFSPRCVKVRRFYPPPGVHV